MTDYRLNPLEPIYAPWEEPNRHRVKNESGGPAIVKPGRRPSRALLVPYLRDHVALWRDARYPGATETTRSLLAWWFETAHPTADGEFRYHYAQREAVETVIWLYEVAKVRSLSDLFASVLPDEHRDYTVLVRGVPEDEDAWPRFCSKVATGGGKTKCMSLVVAWSFFNSLFESADLFPRHFLLVAPNLIVFERLRADFESGRIFAADPVLPPEFASAFNLEVVLQDAGGGSSSTGALYLSNIHRLYDKDDDRARPDDAPAWAGPNVKRAQVFKTGERLRARISEHPCVLVLNDEAHHLHDPDLAWNRALFELHRQSVAKGNRGLLLQSDFTATPKHNDGDLFRHVVSDFPLGEAVDAGIVKVPVIGRSDEIKENLAEDAYDRYRVHLSLGYQQYKQAFAEHAGSRKPILFVMTEDTRRADEIAHRLGEMDAWPGDPEPNLLKGRVLNLHTHLKGSFKTETIGGKKVKVFEPGEKKIGDEDLRVIRRWSQELDGDDSPYRCVVSVLMLREGWDVRNVTTIVPLRAYSAKSNILAEQTLGRGLRRMYPAGTVEERVTVVEHPAFTRFYEEELQQEGLDVGIADLGQIKPQSVTVFVDFRNKPVEELEIEVPRVSDAIEATATLEGITFDEVAALFRADYVPLPVGNPRKGPSVLIEKTLFTDEVVNVIELDRGLFSLGMSGAISVFARQLEKLCRLQSSFSTLAPLLQRFFCEVLFERPIARDSTDVDHRLGDLDVREHVLAVFLPLLRSKVVTTRERKRLSQGERLSTWRNYQATRTDRRPCVPGTKTMFNLVPCDSEFEAEFAAYLDDCEDVVAFAKNAGPQKLMLDFLSHDGRRSLYVPDFFVRTSAGTTYLLETKGAEDPTVSHKAKAAIAWCKAASSPSCPWRYLFVSQTIFEQVAELSIERLAAACQPKLVSLLATLETGQATLPLDPSATEIRGERTDRFTEGLDLKALPEYARQIVEQAVNQLAYDKRVGSRRLNAAFTILLEPFEVLAGELLKQELESYVPAAYDERRYYFDPYLEDVPARAKSELQKHQRNLQRNLVHDAHSNRIGNLLFCLAFAGEPEYTAMRAGGVWDDVSEAFSEPPLQSLRPLLVQMNEFRNRRVVHVEEPITDVETAETNLRLWIEGLIALARTLI